MSPNPRTRRPSARLLLALCGLLAVVACKPAPPATAVPADGPQAAVHRLAQRLHDNDLAGFARDAVPPDQHVRLETAWREGRSRWPLTELPLDEQLEPLLETLAAPGSERTLQAGFKRNFANQDKDLRDAARSLGLFGVQYVKREGIYTAEERAHYAQVITALSEWAARAPLGDPKRGMAAIPPLAIAARQTGLTSMQAFQDAGMGGSLQRLAPFFAQAKRSVAGYGLSLDQSLAGLHTSIIEQQGERARVRIRYPLAGHDIDTVVSLERRQGRWYLSDHLRHAEQALAATSQESPAPANQTVP